MHFVPFDGFNLSNGYAISTAGVNPEISLTYSTGAFRGAEFPTPG
jgi:hypothetical protein